MKLWPIVLSAAFGLSLALPAAAQSAPPSPDPRLRSISPPAPAGAMPDRAMPPRFAPSGGAPMAVPPPPPGEVLPPSERSVPTSDSGRSSGEAEPVRPGAR